MHAVPTDGEALERLARTCGYRSSRSCRRRSPRSSPSCAASRPTVRSIHERLFFRPLLEAFDAVPPRTVPVDGLAPSGRSALQPSALRSGWPRSGSPTRQRTREALVELTRGLTRTVALMQQMLPLLLGWLSESPDPDAGLLGLRSLAATAAPGRQRWCACSATHRTARTAAVPLLGSSRFVALGLERHPELIADLADPSLPAPVTRGLGRRAARPQPLRWRRPAERLVPLRRSRREQELAIAARDLFGPRRRHGGRPLAHRSRRSRARGGPGRGRGHDRDRRAGRGDRDGTLRRRGAVVCERSRRDGRARRRFRRRRGPRPSG